MPIYAFECTGCGHHFERLQRLSDADPTQCPECESSKVRRQLTAPSFRLAGGGWYETDFKKDGKRNLAEKGDAPKPEATAKSEAPAKSDSKPASTEAAKPSPPKPAAPKSSE
jgi:putative FmdB family regulatory protein